MIRMAVNGSNHIGAICPFVAFVMESRRGFIGPIGCIGFMRFTG